MKLSNDFHIHFVLEKGIGKFVILKKHAEILGSILNYIKNLCSIEILGF